MRQRSTIFVSAVVVVAAALAAHACDTPVYRYAMYRWQPAPYEIYHFHRGPLSPAASDLAAKAGELAGDVKQAANLVFLPIDLEKDPELKTVPPDVAAIWKKEEAAAGETCLVVSPLGFPVFRGELTAESLTVLVDSPVRKKIGQSLAAGQAGVFLLLANNDAEACAQAEKLLAELAAEVRAGKLDLYVAPENGGPTDERPDRPSAAPGERLPVPRGGGKKAGEEADEKAAGKKPADSQSAKASAEIGVIVVRRSDPAEKWLVRQLLAVESDLAEIDQPMIFTAFGRGRVMPPLVGKGIKRDNLVESLHYVTGACVCTVRDQNPGVDLLTRFDWTAAAEKMASQHSAEEGARFALRDLQLFPESPALEVRPADPMSVSPPGAGAAETPIPEPAKAKGEESQPEKDSPLKASDLAPPPPTKIVTPPAPPAETAPAATPTAQLLAWLGGGLAVAVVVLAAATWWLLRGGPAP